MDNKIKEGNHLIAEFIGLRSHGLFPEEYEAPFGFEWMAVYINTAYAFDRIDQLDSKIEDYFQFQSSWDWLMPVLQKISDHGCIVEISYALVTSCRICVIDGKTEKAFNIIHDNNDVFDPIIPVWKAVVEYVTYLQSK